MTLGKRMLFAEPDIGNLDPPLDRLVARALAKDPDQRPTAQELLLELAGGTDSNDTNDVVSHALHQSWRPNFPPMPPGIRRRPPRRTRGCPARKPRPRRRGRPPSPPALRASPARGPGADATASRWPPRRPAGRSAKPADAAAAGTASSPPHRPDPRGAAHHWKTAAPLPCRPGLFGRPSGPPVRAAQPASSTPPAPPRQLPFPAADRLRGARRGASGCGPRVRPGLLPGLVLLH